MLYPFRKLNTKQEPRHYLCLGWGDEYQGKSSLILGKQKPHLARSTEEGKFKPIYLYAVEALENQVGWKSKIFTISRLSLRFCLSISLNQFEQFLNLEVASRCAMFAPWVPSIGAWVYRRLHRSLLCVCAMSALGFLKPHTPNSPQHVSHSTTLTDLIRLIELFGNWIAQVLRLPCLSFG